MMLRMATFFVLLMSVNVFGECKLTLSHPYFKCDTMFEARKLLMRRQALNQYEEVYTEFEEEDEYDEYNSERHRFTTIYGNYREPGVEVIIDPYEGLGDFEEPEVYEIDIRVLRRLKIEN